MILRMFVVMLCFWISMSLMGLLFLLMKGIVWLLGLKIWVLVIGVNFFMLLVLGV